MIPTKRMRSPAAVVRGREHHPTAARPYDTSAMTEGSPSHEISRSPRPVSQQRYAMRRLVVVAALGLGLFGAVKGASSVIDRQGDGPEVDASGTTPSTTVAAGASDGTSAQVAAVTTPPTPPLTEPDETGPPTEDNPAEVLIVGDSDAGTFFPYLQGILGETGVVDAEVDYVVSSGLARPDFHDWPAHLADTLDGSDPDIVIVTFGGNDAQGITEPCPNGAGSCGVNVVVPQATAENAAEWKAEYASRVGAVMDLLTENPDRRVIWVGIPNAQDPEFTALLQVQDQAVRQALESYPDAVFVDTWEIFDGRNGGIAELVVDPRDGTAKPVRQSDGFHLNADGAEILAIDIAAQVETILEDLGADL